MNPAHIHLVIHDFPIVASVLGALLLTLALARRSDKGVLLSATVVLALSGITSIGALRSGHGAEEMVEDLPGFDERRIEEHEERADWAVWIAIATGVAAIGVLAAVWRRPGPVPAAWLVGLLIAALLTVAAMGWTAQAGGNIRHTEIRSSSD